MSNGFCHQPVLAEEVSTFLAPRPGGVYVDATVGGAGHASLLAERIAPGGVLIGIDRDLSAVEAARVRLAGVTGVRIILIHDSYANLSAILHRLGLPMVDGILFDLGLSSPQVDQAERGFSYQKDAPLDMRMDQRQFLTAQHLVNEVPQAELARIIFQYGEERWARRIAEFIVKERQDAPIETTAQLVRIIKAAVPAGARRGGHHPARRTFQALRIAVNGELDALQLGLRAALDHLAPASRIVVISFHSLEDRLVKEEFVSQSAACRCPLGLPVCQCGGPTIEVLTRRPVVAGPTEVHANPRARSAKLRAAARLV